MRITSGPPAPGREADAATLAHAEVARDDRVLAPTLCMCVRGWEGAWAWVCVCGRVGGGWVCMHQTSTVHTSHMRADRCRHLQAKVAGQLPACKEALCPVWIHAMGAMHMAQTNVMRKHALGPKGTHVRALTRLYLHISIYLHICVCIDHTHTHTQTAGSAACAKCA